MNHADLVKARIARKEARVGIIGLGYVGLPLAAATAGAGFATVGFDIDVNKIIQLEAGRSYISAVSDEEIARLHADERLRATSDFAQLRDVDIIIICVPTPLTRHREPDTTYIEHTARSVAETLRPGQVVVLESTTYPGTTTGLVKPILEAGGLRSGRDFFLGYSPEREDPGNPTFRTRTIPKIVSGEGDPARDIVAMFYALVVEEVVAVGSPEVAEATKLTENIFRAVNIALVNELKVIYSEMGIDIWEVIEAARTKPFGYMPFYPGPGLGGHCIPIDPFYLTWIARAHEVPTRFIELAGEINVAMPKYVVDTLARALDERFRKGLHGSRVLILGAAYKKNVSDMRESPTLRLIELLEERGAEVAFHDPHVAAIPPTREHGRLAGRRSIPLSEEALKGYDAVLIATDHDRVDYELVSRAAALVVDTRNAMGARDLPGRNVVKA